MNYVVVWHIFIPSSNFLFDYHNKYAIPFRFKLYEAERGRSVELAGVQGGRAADGAATRVCCIDPAGGGGGPGRDSPDTSHYLQCNSAIHYTNNSSFKMYCPLW